MIWKVMVRIDDEDQAIILLRSLQSKNDENFADTILYEKYSINILEVKVVLNSKNYKI